MPILHGMVAITVVALFQVFLERVINLNRKVEAVMEGSPNLVVSDGVINWDCMKRDNISKEDLFRALREKDVQHLGEVHKAFFGTSATISVFFYSPKKVQPGLAVQTMKWCVKKKLPASVNRCREKERIAALIAV